MVHIWSLQPPELSGNETFGSPPCGSAGPSGLGHLVGRRFLNSSTLLDLIVLQIARQRHRRLKAYPLRHVCFGNTQKASTPNGLRVSSIRCSSSASSLLYSLEWSDTKVYEPSIRALLGTAPQFCEVVVLKSRTLWGRCCSRRCSSTRRSCFHHTRL